MFKRTYAPAARDARPLIVICIVCLVIWLSLICCAIEFMLEAQDRQAQLDAVRVWENKFSAELRHHGRAND